MAQIYTKFTKIISKKYYIISPLAGGTKGGIELLFIPLLTSPARGGNISDILFQTFL